MQVLQVCQAVLKCFEETRAKINEEAKGAALSSSIEAAIRPWQFETALVFGRLNQYVERVTMFAGILNCAFDYAKLEKVELSGPKLNAHIVSMYAASGALLEEIGRKTGDEGYNPLDPTVPNFVADYDDYMHQIRGFDRHLATLARQAWRADGTLEGYFKIMVGFQGLLDRPEIHQEVSWPTLWYT